MKKLLSYLLILPLVGITLSSCENTSVRKDAASRIPELMVELIGLTTNAAHDKMIENGYTKTADHYEKDNVMFASFSSSGGEFVNYSNGQYMSQYYITQTAYLWLNSVAVMGYVLNTGYIMNLENGETKKFNKLSDMKSAIKGMNGSWAMEAELSNANKGINLGIVGHNNNNEPGENSVLEVGVFRE